MVNKWANNDIPATRNQTETGSLVNLYFRDAARHPLLSASEERRLVRKLARCYRLIAEELRLPEDTPHTYRVPWLLLSSGPCSKPSDRQPRMVG